MKKRILLAAVILLCSCILVGAVLKVHKDTRQHKEYPVTRVSVILPHNDSGYWSLIAEGVETAEAELGEAYNIDISMHIPQLNYNIPQMVVIIKQQIAAKVDVLVVQGNDNEKFLEVLQEAYNQDIRIICADTDLTDFPEHLYIGTDNYNAGKMMGEKIVKLTGGKAKIAIISGEEGYLNLTQRIQGVEDVIGDYPEMEIQGIRYDNYDSLTFMKQYYQISETMPDVDTLVCIEGTGAQTLSKVFSEPQLQYEHIIGFDISECVENGVVDGVLIQDTYQIGYLVVEEIAHAIKYGTYSADEIYTDIEWVEVTQ